MLLDIIYKIENKIHWALERRKMKFVGQDVHIAGGFRIKGHKYIHIGDFFRSDYNLKIEAWDSYNEKKLNSIPEIIIGENVTMMSNCQISAINRVEIGDGCLLGDNVFITDNFHGNNQDILIEPLKRELIGKGPVIIGRNVWIGRNVCILSGVTIGDGAIIGANAVVTHDVKSGSVVGGIPAIEL